MRFTMGFAPRYPAAPKSRRSPDLRSTATATTTLATNTKAWFEALGAHYTSEGGANLASPVESEAFTPTTEVIQPAAPRRRVPLAARFAAQRILNPAKQYNFGNMCAYNAFNPIYYPHLYAPTGGLTYMLQQFGMEPNLSNKPTKPEEQAEEVVEAKLEKSIAGLNEEIATEEKRIEEVEKEKENLEKPKEKVSLAKVGYKRIKKEGGILGALIEAQAEERKAKVEKISDKINESEQKITTLKKTKIEITKVILNLYNLHIDIIKDAKKVEKLKLMHLNYKVQGELARQNATDYADKIIEHEKTRSRFLENKAEYNKILASFSDKNKEYQKAKLENLFTNPELVKKEENSKNRESAALLIDVLNHQIENLQFTELEQCLSIIKDSEVITRRLDAEDKQKILINIAPALHKLGRHDLIERYFTKTERNAALKTILGKDITDKTKLHNTIMQKLIQAAASNSADFKSIDEATNQFKLLIALQGKDIAQLQEGHNYNILHSIITEAMEITLGGLEHNKMVAKLETYRKFFEVLAENVEPDVLSEMLNHRDNTSYTQTPMQLFYFLAQQKDNRENAVFLFETLFNKSGGQIDIPIPNPFFTAALQAIYTGTAFAASRLTDRFLWKTEAPKTYPEFAQRILAQTFQDCIFDLANPKHKVAEEKNKRMVETGTKERFDFDFGNIAFVGAQNCGGMFTTPSAIKNSSIKGKLNAIAANNKAYNTEHAIVNNHSIDSDHFKNLPTTTKIEIYRNLMLRRDMQKRELSRPATTYIAYFMFGIFYDPIGWCREYITKQRKADFETAINEIESALNSILRNLKEIEEFKDLISHFESEFKSILSLRSNDDDTIPNIAEEIALNKDAGFAFDKIYRMIKEGMLPLEHAKYDNIEKLHKAVIELRIKQAKDTTVTIPKTTTDTCQKLKDFVNYEIKIKILVPKNKENLAKELEEKAKLGSKDTTIETVEETQHIPLDQYIALHNQLKRERSLEFKAVKHTDTVINNLAQIANRYTGMKVSTTTYFLTAALSRLPSIGGFAIRVGVNATFAYIEQQGGGVLNLISASTNFGAAALTKGTEMLSGNKYNTGEGGVNTVKAALPPIDSPER